MGFFERPGRALRGFIPRRVSAGAVLGFLELLRARRAASPEPESAPGALVEDQWRYAAAPYGRSTLAHAGCEVIAVYNALLWLTGAAPPLEALARCFERDGMVLRGRLGTSPRAAGDYFRRRGWRVRAASRPEGAEACRAALLSYWNDRNDVTAGLHTVCCTRGAEGWTVHNLHCDGHVPPPRLTLDALTRSVLGARGKTLYLLALEPPEAAHKNAAD